MSDKTLGILIFGILFIVGTIVISSATYMFLTIPKHSPGIGEMNSSLMKMKLEEKGIVTLNSNPYYNRMEFLSLSNGDFLTFVERNNLKTVYYWAGNVRFDQFFVVVDGVRIITYTNEG